MFSRLFFVLCLLDVSLGFDACFANAQDLEISFDAKNATVKDKEGNTLIQASYKNAPLELEAKPDLRDAVLRELVDMDLSHVGNLRKKLVTLRKKLAFIPNLLTDDQIENLIQIKSSLSRGTMET